MKVRNALTGCFLLFIVAIALAMSENVIAQDRYSIMIGKVVEISGSWMKVENEQDKTVTNFRIGRRTVFNPYQLPPVGTKVKTEYLQYNVPVAFYVTFLEGPKGKTAESEKSYGLVLGKTGVPVWDAGDTWTYIYPNKREWRFVVERVKGDFYIANVGSSDKYCFNKKNLEIKYFVNPQGKKVYPLNENLLFGIYLDPPIYVGKKWGKIVSGQSSSRTSLDYLHEFKVISFEDISVPAGELRAFKIELKRSVSAHSSSGFVKHYIWYSPEVKNLVKYYRSEISGTWTMGLSDYELVSYNLVRKHDDEE